MLWKLAKVRASVQKRGVTVALLKYLQIGEAVEAELEMGRAGAENVCLFASPLYGRVEIASTEGGKDEVKALEGADMFVVEDDGCFS